MELPFAATIVGMLSLLMSSSSLPVVVAGQGGRYDAVNYGAVGDGKTDDSSAFMKAWNDACKDNGTTTSTVIVPGGKTFLVYLLDFNGPCRSNGVTVQLDGTIVAPDDPYKWDEEQKGRWIVFDGVDGLTLTGRGVIDGRGKVWWDISCKHNPGKESCNTRAPTAVGFRSCKNVRVSNIKTLNPGGGHYVAFACESIEFRDLMLEAPGNSPNTDGIHISHSRNIWVFHTVIATGDDCVSIVDQTENILVQNVKCGPGHGVSIGSLGGGGDMVHVANITVRRVVFQNTTNGVRIKTWQVGEGLVRRVVFSDITFAGVQNPIIIDQHYGDPSPLPNAAGIHIDDVLYHNVGGTSSSKVAVNLNCSRNVACTHISLEEIRIGSAVQEDPEVVSRCQNAYGSAKGVIQPEHCLVTLD